MLKYGDIVETEYGTGIICAYEFSNRIDRYFKYGVLHTSLKKQLPKKFKIDDFMFFENVTLIKEVNV